MKTFQVSFPLFALLLSANALFAQSPNLTTVQQNYARFGQGDVPGILSTMTEDAVWTHPGNPAIIPFAGTFTGPAEIGRFFENVGKSVQITRFEPFDFVENGNTVVNKINIAGTSLETGKTYSAVMEFRWMLNAEGKVTSWQAIGDVSTLELALTR